MTCFNYFFSFLEKIQHEYSMNDDKSSQIIIKNIFFLKHSWFIAVFSGFERDVKMKSAQ